MTNSRFDEVFGGPPRKPESELTQREMDIAASIQVVTEEVVLRLAKTLHKETGEKNLCLAGGVALNCVANGRLLREGPSGFSRPPAMRAVLQEPPLLSGTATTNSRVR
jgi:carbamoyltransferase